VAYHERVDDPIATAVGTFMLGANRAQPAILGGPYANTELPPHWSRSVVMTPP
jgi:hypothetical protein